MSKLEELIKCVKEKEAAVNEIVRAQDHSKFSITFSEGCGRVDLSEKESEKIYKTLTEIGEDRAKALATPKGKLDALNELLEH